MVGYKVILVLPYNSDLNMNLNNISEELVTVVNAQAESQGQDCNSQSSESLLWGGTGAELGQAMWGGRFHLMPLGRREKTLTSRVSRTL